MPKNPAIKSFQAATVCFRQRYFTVLKVRLSVLSKMAKQFQTSRGQKACSYIKGVQLQQDTIKIGGNYSFKADQRQQHVETGIIWNKKGKCWYIYFWHIKMHSSPSVLTLCCYCHFFFGAVQVSCSKFAFPVGKSHSRGWEHHYDSGCFSGSEMLCVF